MSDNVLDDFINKKSERAEEYHGILEDMMAEGRYDYAQDVLLGIMDFIEEHKNITEKQIQAIENIKAKPGQRQWD